MGKYLSYEQHLKDLEEISKQKMIKQQKAIDEENRRLEQKKQRQLAEQEFKRNANNTDPTDVTIEQCRYYLLQAGKKGRLFIENIEILMKYRDKSVRFDVFIQKMNEIGISLTNVKSNGNSKNFALSTTEQNMDKMLQNAEKINAEYSKIMLLWGNSDNSGLPSAWMIVIRDEPGDRETLLKEPVYVGDEKCIDGYFFIIENIERNHVRIRIKESTCYDYISRRHEKIPGCVETISRYGSYKLGECKIHFENHWGKAVAVFI